MVLYTKSLDTFIFLCYALTMNNLTVSYIIKNSYEANFNFYRQGYIYYRIVVKHEYDDERPYIFPVEVNDLGTATLNHREKPITMMRYIRKALENGSFVRAN